MEKKEICPICYENLEDKTYVILGCYHKYCLDCLDNSVRYLHISNCNKCPMCRTKIIPNDCSMYYNESEWKVMKDEIIEKENKLANLLDKLAHRKKIIYLTWETILKHNYYLYLRRRYRVYI